MHVVDGAGFDLIFADAPGGKFDGLDRTIGALRPGGVLVVDDMRPGQWWTDARRATMAMVRRTLLGHPELEGIELDVGSGVILCTRQ
jgi:predicted O-methyltransferase YrrM